MSVDNTLYCHSSNKLVAICRKVNIRVMWYLTWQTSRNLWESSKGDDECVYRNLLFLFAVSSIINFWLSRGSISKQGVFHCRRTTMHISLSKNCWLGLDEHNEKKCSALVEALRERYSSPTKLQMQWRKLYMIMWRRNVIRSASKLACD